MILFYCVRVSVQPPSSCTRSRSISVHVAAGQLASCQQQCRHQHHCSPCREGEYHPAFMYIHHSVLLTNLKMSSGVMSCVAHTHSPLVMAVVEARWCARCRLVTWPDSPVWWEPPGHQTPATRSSLGSGMRMLALSPVQPQPPVSISIIASVSFHKYTVIHQYQVASLLLSLIKI